ncbi:MLO-like protein [Rutidosis leptorrhynchoides]|uniref:MLO-like protein n=1 Tax=Rutidosis leptorrhynchoides TaxID=125765 RepID=UPI003A99B677
MFYVVGIIPSIWATAILFVFANGALAITYPSLLPVIIILAVGTKLRAIVTQMAVEIQERQSIVQGIPVVELLSDRHFWFNQPKLIPYLIQLTLFQWENQMDKKKVRKP